MYVNLLLIGVVAVFVSGLVGTAVLHRKQQARNSTLDSDARPATVRHPILANPIFYFYVGIPIATVAIGMIWLYFST